MVVARRSGRFSMSGMQVGMGLGMGYDDGGVALSAREGRVGITTLRDSSECGRPLRAYQRWQEDSTCRDVWRPWPCRMPAASVARQRAGGTMSQAHSSVPASGRDPRCLVSCRDVLGEGAFWDERDGTLIWVDIYECLVHQWSAATQVTRTWTMPERIGFVLPRRGGGYIAGLRSGLSWLSLPEGTLTHLAQPERDRPGNRFNDGKCDAQGRLWAGTMDNAMVHPSGALYRCDPDLRITRADDGYIVTNGPTFSPDERTLYHTASVTRTIYAFDLDPHGTLSRKRVFHQFAPEYGYPDGMATDTAGCIWVAMSGSSQLVRLTPGGAIDRCVPMPVTRPTSCVFGGADFATLYVTSATVLLDAEVLAREPLAGALFALDVGARGFPGNRFGG